MKPNDFFGTYKLNASQKLPVYFDKDCIVWSARVNIIKIAVVFHNNQYFMFRQEISNSYLINIGKINISKVWELWYDWSQPKNEAELFKDDELWKRIKDYQLVRKI